MCTCAATCDGRMWRNRSMCQKAVPLTARAVLCIMAYKMQACPLRVSRPTLAESSLAALKYFPIGYEEALASPKDCCWGRDALYWVHGD